MFEDVVCLTCAGGATSSVLLTETSFIQTTTGGRSLALEMKGRQTDRPRCKRAAFLAQGAWGSCAGALGELPKKLQKQPYGSVSH